VRAKRLQTLIALVVCRSGLRPFRAGRRVAAEVPGLRHWALTLRPFRPMNVAIVPQEARLCTIWLRASDRLRSQGFATGL
jgi:hypothetical protein